ncbi:MAG: hypothetical protein FJ318_08375 [SAR202 cluster bacterium]|nr:hypothetical protein [SAR202 cluster bacterium]
MFIMDFEDEVTIVSLSGQRHAARLAALVEPDNPASAGLGHAVLSLADQSWKEARLRTKATLDFEVGAVVFRDGSRRDGEVSLAQTDGDERVYAVTFTKR